MLARRETENIIVAGQREDEAVNIRGYGNLAHKLERPPLLRLQHAGSHGLRNHGRRGTRLGYGDDELLARRAAGRVYPKLFLPVKLRPRAGDETGADRDLCDGRDAKAPPEAGVCPRGLESLLVELAEEAGVELAGRGAPYSSAETGGQAEFEQRAEEAADPLSGRVGGRDDRGGLGDLIVGWAVDLDCLSVFLFRGQKSAFR